MNVRFLLDNVQTRIFINLSFQVLDKIPKVELADVKIFEDQFSVGGATTKYVYMVRLLW